MPTFTISKGGQTLDTLHLEGDRIEIGSANSCQVFLDDLLVSLKQAVLTKTTDGYQIEPLARTPSFTINGQTAEGPMNIATGAVLEVEGYQVRIDFQLSATPEAVMPQPESSKATSLTPEPQITPENDLPPLPPPLDLASTPVATPSPVAVPSPEPPPAPSSQPPTTEDKTVFVAKPVGQLVAVAGPLGARSWPLQPGEVKIGRDQSQNDIAIRTDAQGQVDKSISRRHASIHVSDAGVSIEDKNSAAGTFVNGQQVHPGNRVPLTNGDQVEIRSAKESSLFRVELVGSQQPIPPPLDVPPPLVEPPPRLETPPTPPRSAPPPAPRYEPPPRAPEPEPDSPRRRRRRERSGAGPDDNPFASGAGSAGTAGMPKWVWLVAAGALVIAIIVLIFLIR